ncbi:MAG: DUF4388 domain-containing protein [Nitrospirota bacterium]|nr:DUF4388 domain-containing protein [Nitrospirota bacterium]
MPRDRAVADVLQEVLDARKTGAYFITTKESSEDLFKIYTRDGEIRAVTYGSAQGQEALEILEFYTLANGTFFEGFDVPPGVAPIKFPMKKFIAMMRNARKMIRVP